MNVQPLNEHVLLKPVEAAAKTAGGLYLPETAKEAPDEGTIEALPAEGADELAIGDRVIFKKYAGEKLTIDGSEFKLIQTGDLLAKYVEADAIPE